MQKDPGLALVVVGEGPETPQLMQLAVELELESAVRFLGAVPESGWPTMVDVLSGGDIYCSVPETDGGPLSVLEAMACGLPVVVSEIPVMQEWIEPGVTGVLAGGTPVDVSEALLSAVPRMAEMGASARRYVASKHNRTHEMDRAFRVYERLLRGRGNGV